MCFARITIQFRKLSHFYIITKVLLNLPNLAHPVPTSLLYFEDSDEFAFERLTVAHEALLVASAP